MQIGIARPQSQKEVAMLVKLFDKFLKSQEKNKFHVSVVELLLHK